MDILYQKICSEISRRIKSGELRPGSKIPSLREICKIYKVSQITALRVFEELKNKKLISLVPGVGYYVQSASEKDQNIDFSRLICCALRPIRPYCTDDNFFNDIYSSIQRTLTERGYSFIYPHDCVLLRELEHEISFYNFANKLKEAVINFSSVCAGVLLDERFDDNTALEIYETVKKPVLLVNRKSKTVHSVSVAYEELAASLIDLLLKLKYKKFILANHYQNVSIQNVRDASAQILQQLKKKNVPEKNIAVIPDLFSSHKSVADASREILSEYDSALKTVIIFNSDSIALEHLKFICSSGIAVDGNRLGAVSTGPGFFHPSQTKVATVFSNPLEIGQKSVDSLIHLIIGGKLERNIFADYKIDIKNSL